MKKKKGSRYQRQMGATVYRSADNDNKSLLAAQKRRQKQALGEALDEQFGMERFALTSSYQEEKRRRGWLYNMLVTTVRTIGLLVV